jgi:hypothetical protein
VCCAVLVPLLQACYTYVPLTSPTPEVGETFAFEISDQGRVGLAQRFGPGLKEVEGRIVANESSDYVINVFRVSQISGESSQWSGETTRINRDYVTGVRARQLSRGRTALAIAGGAAVAVVLIASRGLFGSYSHSPDEPTPEPPISGRIPVTP